MTPVCGRFDRLDLVPGQHFDPALGERLLQFGCDFLILQRHDARQHLDDGHIHAVGIPDRGELHADGARPDDDHDLGQFLLQDGFQIGDDLLAVHFPGCRDSRAGAGGDDDILGLEFCQLAVFIGNGNGVFGAVSFAVPM